MKNLLRALLLGAVVGIAGLAWPHSAEAQDYDDSYWHDYWHWYDNDYAPYYSRRYYRDPYSYYDYGYGDPYYYRGYRGWVPGGGVQVGPLGIYWR